MVQDLPVGIGFSQDTASTLFSSCETRATNYPIQLVSIDWECLIAQRPLLLKNISDMPRYLLKPEILLLINAEKNLTYRLMLDLMWTTGARVSEVLALRPDSFVQEGCNFGVHLNPLNQHPGRPSNSSLSRASRRYVPVVDGTLIDRIESYLRMAKYRKNNRMFPMARQTVNRHIHSLIKRVGGAPFPVSTHTFRHSFAVHLLLHGRPLKYVAQLLGHKSADRALIYTNVLTLDGGNFMQGVDFH